MTPRRAGCAAAAAAAVLVVAALLVPERAPAPGDGWMSAAGVTPAFVDIDGMRIRYVRAGSGPPIVFLHGFASSIYTWKDVLPALAASHDVVALDFPGFGGSSIPRPGNASYLDVVLAIMHRLGFARASLVGNSLGGAIAALLASDHPDRVDRLVLIDSAGFNLEARDRPALLRLAGAPRVAPLLERLPVRRRLVVIALRQVFYDDALVTRERVDAYAAPLMRPGALAAAASVLNHPFPDLDLPRIHAPTLVIWGREDRWIPVRDAARFTAAIPGATAVVLGECGHVPQEEKPAEVAALLQKFLGPAARVD